MCRLRETAGLHHQPLKGHDNSGHLKPLFTLLRREVEVGALVTYQRAALRGTEPFACLHFLSTCAVWHDFKGKGRRGILFCILYEGGLTMWKDHTTPLIKAVL